MLPLLAPEPVPSSAVNLLLLTIFKIASALVLIVRTVSESPFVTLTS